MKYFKKLMLLAVLVLSALACKNDDGETIPSSGPVDDNGRVVLEGDISENRTLTSKEKYILKGLVYVPDGVTLTIEPGTVIFGDKDSKGTLIIERGGKILAEGAADKPIVFTSAQPKGSRFYGDWGGVVIAGKAPVNQVDPTMEGGIRGSYGGTNVNDNSGILKYVRIEFPGIAFQTDKEINGLTLYGVGAATTMDYIQVSYSGDDSFEWFGGTVNAKHIIAHRGWDDDFDTDFDFTGNVQFALALRDPEYADKSTSNSFESDNFDPGTPASDLITMPTFSNVSVFLTTQSSLPTSKGSGNHGRAMHLRRNTKTSVYNSIFVGHAEGLRLDGNATWANLQAGDLEIKGVTLANNPTALKNANPSGETSTFSATDLTNWFNDANRHNSVISNADLASLKLNANSFNLTTPNFLPETESPLLSGAIFDGRAANAFFEKVEFKGAVGTINWMESWTNFDPQNTDY